MSFRKEIKFKLSKSDLYIYKNSLIKKGMKHLYPKRKINSIYFDTQNLKMFHESEEGVLPRKKIRFRWYANQSICNKEIKISSIEGRYKIICPKNLLNVSSLKFHRFFEKDYGMLTPKLNISYKREYFLYKDLRITFDTDIEYENIKSISSLKFKDDEFVVEVKTDKSTSEDYIEKFINIQTSRFSKYCRGIYLINK